MSRLEPLLEEDGGDGGRARAEAVSEHHEPRLLLLQLEHLDALENLGRVLVQERVGGFGHPAVGLDAGELGQGAVEILRGAVAVGEGVLHARRAANHEEYLVPGLRLADEERRFLEGALLDRVVNLVPDRLERGGELVPVRQVRGVDGDAQSSKVVRLVLVHRAAGPGVGLIRAFGLGSLALIPRVVPEVRHTDGQVPDAEAPHGLVVGMERGGHGAVVLHPPRGVPGDFAYHRHVARGGLAHARVARLLAIDLPWISS